MHEPAHAIVTAALLVIGDEILSGRTKDKNIGFIAEYLTNIGIDLKEVRVVADEEAEIIAALDALPAIFGSAKLLGGGKQRLARGDSLAGPVAQRTVRLDDALGLDMADPLGGFVLPGVF